MSTAPRIKFAQIKGFPALEGEKILTEAFIDASNEIIAVIEQFGTIFYPVIKDMRNNSTQLRNFYLVDVERRKYIEDMILYDESRTAHVWLLWLKRALEMIERFFWHILNSNEIVNQKSDNLQPMMMMSYTEVLEPYHGFFLQKTFKMLYRLMPSRRTLLGADDHFHDNISNLKELRPNMQLHITKIDKFLKENGLDDNSRV